MNVGNDGERMEIFSANNDSICIEAQLKLVRNLECALFLYMQWNFGQILSHKRRKMRKFSGLYLLLGFGAAVSP